MYSSARDFDRQLHDTLGFFVVGLALLRLAWRAGAATPPEPTSVPHRMAIIGKGVQLTMYVLFIALPLTAVMDAWLEGHSLTFLAGVQIEPMLSKSHEMGEKIAEIHTWLGDTIMWLAGLHAFAAPYHHLPLKDGVLASMLPHRLFRNE